MKKPYSRYNQVMARKRNVAAKKQNEARIQKAVSSFRIPMMSIPKLYTALEQAIGYGWSDAELRVLVSQFPVWRMLDDEAKRLEH